MPSKPYWRPTAARLPEVGPPLPVQPASLESKRNSPGHTGSDTPLLVDIPPGWISLVSGRYHSEHFCGHSQILLQRPPNSIIAEVRGTHVTGPENGTRLDQRHRESLGQRMFSQRGWCLALLQPGIVRGPEPTPKMARPHFSFSGVLQAPPSRS